MFTPLHHGYHVEKKKKKIPDEEPFKKYDGYHVVLTLVHISISFHFLKWIPHFKRKTHTTSKLSLSPELTYLFHCATDTT